MAPARPLVYMRIRKAISNGNNIYTSKLIFLDEKDKEPFCEVDAAESTIFYDKMVGNESYGTPIPKSAKFDQIFDTTSTQEDVFLALWPKIVSTFKEGFSSTLLMYGATGSGKTYTMDGKFNLKTKDEQSRGICPRSVESFFDFLDKSAEKGYEVQLRYVEAYNDKVYDLLTEANEGTEVIVQKPLKWTQELHPKKLKSHKEFDTIYSKAVKKRTTATNKINKDSSRSHSIVHIKVLWTPLKSKAQITSEMFFVDLAGAEKYQKSKTTKMDEIAFEELRNQEGICINKALSALSNCVSALNAKMKDPNKHIPFKDNILTKLLNTSFNGNNALMLVVCIPNLKEQNKENDSTIDFGLRCLKLKVDPKKNEITMESDLSETLDKEKLMYRIKELESKINKPLEEKETVVIEIKQPDNSDEVRALRNQLDELNMKLAEKEYEVSLLNETDAELVSLKQQLQDINKSKDQDQNRIATLENKIKEKENGLRQLTEINHSLKELVEKMEDEKKALKLMQDEERSLNMQIVENDSKELQVNLQSSLLQISTKEQEIENLKRKISEVQSKKESVEATANTIHQMLEKKRGYQLEYDRLQQDVTEREENIKELNTILKSYSDSGDNKLNEEAEKTLKSLTERCINLEKELESAKRSSLNSGKRLTQLTDQIESAIIMLPTDLQTKIRKDIVEFDKSVPALNEFKEQAKLIKEALKSLGEDQNNKVNLLQEIPKAIDDKYLPILQSPPESSKNRGSMKKDKSVKDIIKEDPVRKLDESYVIREVQWSNEELIGNNLNEDLINFKNLQNEDELDRFFRKLPNTAHQLGKLLTVYRSFLPRFLEKKGIEKIIDLMINTKYSATFANLCYALESAVYNDETQEIVYNSGIIDFLVKKFESDVWFEENESVNESVWTNTFDMIATIAKFENNKNLLKHKSILKTVASLIYNNGVQKVITSSLKCLIEIFPSRKELEAACDFPLSDLCKKMVLHCEDPSSSVRSTSAMCIARLCGDREYQDVFLTLDLNGHKTVEYFNNKVQTTKDSEVDQFSFALLSLISSDSEHLNFPPLHQNVSDKLYQALATVHASNNRSDNRSGVVKLEDKSKKFPYQCKTIRGSWKFTDNISTNTDGGSTFHTLFTQNPMYKLTVKSPNKDIKSISLAVTLFNANESAAKVSESEELVTRNTYCFVSVFSKTKIMEHAKQANRKFDILQSFVDELWTNNEQRCIFNYSSITHHMNSASATKSVDSFELNCDEDYIIVPFKEVRGQDGEFVLSLAADCDIELQSLNDNYYRKTMIGNLEMPEKYYTNKFAGYSQADWRNGPQVLIKSNNKSIIYLILSMKEFDDQLDLLSQKNEEHGASDIMTKFKGGAYLNLRIFDNSKFSKTQRYIDSAADNMVAFSYILSNHQVITSFVAEPDVEYAVSVVVSGESSSKTLSYPLRLHLISSESEVEYKPVSSFSEEWKAFNVVFDSPFETKPESEFIMNINYGDIHRNDPIALDLSIFMHASSDFEQFIILITDDLSNEKLYNDVIVATSEKYKEMNISLIAKSLTVKNGKGKIKINLTRKTKTAESDPIFRLFGYCNFHVSIENQQDINSVGKNSDETHNQFKFIANIPFYSYGQFNLEEEENSDEKSNNQKSSGKSLKIDESFLQMLYDRIAQQNSIIETLNTRLRPTIVDETLRIVHYTLPNWLPKKEILIKLYNPSVEFIRELFKELNKNFKFGDGLFTDQELLETMDPVMKKSFLENIINHLNSLSKGLIDSSNDNNNEWKDGNKNNNNNNEWKDGNKNNLTSEAFGIIDSSPSGNSKEACNIIIKTLCQGAKKYLTENDLAVRGSGIKAIPR